MLLATILAASMFSQDVKPVTMSRVYKPGQKLAFRVKGKLVTETRQIGLETFIPDDVFLSYDYSLDVLKNLPDGFVQAKYKRPTMTQTATDPQTMDPKTTIDKVGMHLDLTLSPINEIIDLKDLTPKPVPKPKTSGGGGWFTEGGKLRSFTPFDAVMSKQQTLLGSFVGEIYRLSLFMGSLDSALDFQPKLPFEEVLPGATWKRTVSYSPQKLDNKNGKTVMQRLDYLYTYKGIVESNEKKVHRITAELEMNTDLVKYVKDTYGSETAGVKDLKEISLHLKASIDYDLELVSFQTLRATARSKGGYKVVLIQAPENPVVEEKITGETTLRPVTK